MTYDGFFGTAYGSASGVTPAQWQTELAMTDCVDWPQALIAPTGLGKTAGVVLAWAWRQAQGDPTAPRRLVYCLPMRTLVEQTADSTRRWMAALAEFPGLPRGEDIHVLMGGVDEPRWFEHPDRPAVLIGTQDMLLSRALMRGYAMSRFRWPVDFALLHADALWVFDEVQAMGAARPTSTQLEAFRRALGTPRPTRSLWVSATLDPRWLDTVDVRQEPRAWRVPDDFPGDADTPRSRAILSAAKPVHRLDISPGEDTKGYPAALAEAALARHRSGHPTLVIVNTVARAQAVAGALSRDEGPEVLLIHSRFRPADRAGLVARLPRPGTPRDVIIVATQAIEAGVDLSAAVMVTELAPWASLVQRFGRLNRRGEYSAEGAPVFWVDLLGESENRDLAAPYAPDDLAQARSRLVVLADAAPGNLGGPGDPTPVRRVLRRKDLIELFDTDPDLTGFDVDISPYVRDAEDTDVRVFWRTNAESTLEAQPSPSRDELCAIPIGQARKWLKGKTAWHADPQARGDGKDRGALRWRRLDGAPWPGLVLMVDAGVGGYVAGRGFDPGSKAAVTPLPAPLYGDSESADADPDTRRDRAVALGDHLDHVAAEAKALCDRLGVSGAERQAVVTAARWHDVGKAHDSFQQRLGNGAPGAPPLAKSDHFEPTAGRPYFRHELASALAFLAHHDWSREADLAAYLIAAHHGKVRLSLRALPKEPPAPGGLRFARGVREGDHLPAVDGTGEGWPGGALTLSVMELGRDDTTGASWSERTRALLGHYGPFRLAWLETLVRLADWRASDAEQRGTPDA
ncbi:CRISPR-associated endonuclease/helicase Cas3 [Roseospirillum parvum]|uniref:CRISPR-associated endonuclease/helicase Cas3 n=2 Tax=Roseospirillum parvum TaxID=83401 RepID=A0A1G8F9U4_9PROT|nr:CRISPR-associated endonuclease/helicase Cas3 [Roseospirillum parvum]